MRRLCFFIALSLAAASPAAAQTSTVVSPMQSIGMVRTASGVSSAYAITLPNGTCAAPSKTYTSNTGLGSYRIGANNEGFCANSVAAFDYSDTRVNFSLPLLITGASGKNITWNTDGGGDIGASGANRPDNGYFKTSVVVAGNTINVNGVLSNAFLKTASTSYLQFSGRALLRSPADGKITLNNSAETAGVTLDAASDSILKLFARDGTTAGTFVVGNSSLVTNELTLGAQIKIGNTGAGEALVRNNAQTAGVRLNFNTINVLSVLAYDGTNTGTIKGKTHQASAGTFATCNASPVEGMLCAITDSSTATWGATITGGGANHVIGYYNGTNWTVAGK